MTMRNVVVCIKYDLDTSLPLQILADENRVIQMDTANPEYIINSSELCALEEAIRIRPLLDAQVIAISLGPKQVIPALKYCLGRGVDRAIHISVEADTHPLDARNSAAILADEIKAITPLLVLCGYKSSDNGSGMVGPMLAEYLGFPQITEVTKLICTDNKQLTAHRKLERGSRQVVGCKLPALVTVSNFLNHPRYVSVFKQHQFQNSDIETKKVVTPLKEPIYRITNISQPKPRPRKISTPDMTLNASDRLKFMMTGGLVKKDSNVFEGSPDEAATKIYNYLQKNGIL